MSSRPKWTLNTTILLLPPLPSLSDRQDKFDFFQLHHYRTKDIFTPLNFLTLSYPRTILLPN